MANSHLVATPREFPLLPRSEMQLIAAELPGRHLIFQLWQAAGAQGKDRIPLLPAALSAPTRRMAASFRRKLPGRSQLPIDRSERRRATGLDAICDRMAPASNLRALCEVTPPATLTKKYLSSGDQLIILRQWQGIITLSPLAPNDGAPSAISSRRPTFRLPLNWPSSGQPYSPLVVHSPCTAAIWLGPSSFSGSTSSGGRPLWRVHPRA